jgi:hypothetical protein
VWTGTLITGLYNHKLIPLDVIKVKSDSIWLVTENLARVGGEIL